VSIAAFLSDPIPRTTKNNIMATKYQKKKKEKIFFSDEISRFIRGIELYCVEKETFLFWFKSQIKRYLGKSDPFTEKQEWLIELFVNEKIYKYIESPPNYIKFRLMWDGLIAQLLKKEKDDNP